MYYSFQATSPLKKRKKVLDAQIRPRSSYRIRRGVAYWNCLMGRMGFRIFKARFLGATPSWDECFILGVLVSDCLFLLASGLSYPIDKLSQAWSIFCNWDMLLLPFLSMRFSLGPLLLLSIALQFNISLKQRTTYFLYALSPHLHHGGWMRLTRVRNSRCFRVKGGHRTAIQYSP